ncbi:hypothetical protein EBZ37_04365 [bacterium]|nr:hypothetical protein [bacterium]
MSIHSARQFLPLAGKTCRFFATEFFRSPEHSKRRIGGDQEKLEPFQHPARILWNFQAIFAPSLDWYIACCL